jgi:hypothetical protein
MRVTSALLLAAGVTLLLVGCGGGTGGSDAGGGSGGTTGAAGSGGMSGSGGAGGAVMCGDAQCGSSQVCVHPSCGGVLIAICLPLGDAAACPDGWTMRDCANEDGGLGCAPPPCTPPPPSCVDIPAACAGTPSCSCFPENICRQPNGIGGRCAAVNAGNVLCLSS